MKLIKFVGNLFRLDKIQLIKKINTLEVEKLTLEETIKNELYKTFMEKLNESQELASYKKDNKNLRVKVKTLKQLLKGDKDAR